ncbi:ATP-binding protein [Lacibacter sp. H375]|uniref:ATP-binding protein n=1 Tax=Lacibacter sp. H375 TaxID=3133424 RepID=UPI0030BE13F9
MKLTKKLEAEILKLYNDYWDAYLKGDIKTSVSFYDNHITVFGTAKGEIFTNKKAAVKFYKATADQMTGKAEMRKRKIVVKPAGNTIIVNEQFDLYVLAEKEWVFYGHVRLTSIFEQKGDAWKIILHHGSFPDSRTEEGEQIATQKIKKENLQLKEAVQRRTVELESKNKELEIEAALERVRTVAMAMKKADDMLSICKTISQQLKKLGVKEIRNVQTAVIRKEKGTYINYEFYAGHNKLLVTEVSYTDHPMTKAFIKKMLDGPNEFFKRSLKGSKVKEWYVFQKKSTNQFVDEYLLKASSLNYYWYSLGPVALGVSTYAALSNEEQKLVIRFRNVFELAYRRYLDIEKATAQAREAQIELALERVRARAMAMQNSDELAELVSVLFRELTTLDFSLTSCIIWISDTQTSTNTLWVTSAEMNKPAEPVRLKPFQHDFFHSIIHAWKEKDPKWIYTLTGKEKTSFEKTFFANEPNMPGALKKALSVPKEVVFSASFNNFGALEILGTEALSDEKFSILHRFGKVFDSSYTRFNDLKQAEAQAREAQIQLALERVRARSMAMHKSEELADLSLELVKQVQALGVATWFCAFNINDEDPNSSLEWGSNGQGTFPQYRTPREGVFLRYYNAAQNGKTFFINEIGENECPAHYEYLCSLPGVGDQLLQMKNAGIPFPASQIDHVAFFKYGYLLFITYEPVPEAHEIFMRFAKVFEQTYTRFLDLQKAEAQAKEAQIELGLERVRARAMAMYNSKELSNLVALLFEELTKLDLILFRCIIWIFDPKTLTARLWMANAEDKHNAESYFIKRLKHPYYDAIINGWKERTHKWVYELQGDEKKTIDHLLLNETELSRLPKAVKKGILTSKHTTVSGSFNNFGLIEASGPAQHTDEQLDILFRFAKVFDQSYTRFLDLQKAETQAREAKIEAALEKVRARSLAMQKPAELMEVASLLRTEMGKLGVEELETISIYIVDEEKQSAECWYAIKDIREESKRLVSDEITLILNDTWVGKEMWKFCQSAKQQTSIIMKGTNRKEWINYCADRSTVLQGYYGTEIPERTYHLLKFPGGYMGAASPGEISAESWDLLKRAAAVFSLAYTRFKDLQEAEARTKEAQIELALERVRARTMAMQHSNELPDAATILFQQVQSLGMPAWSAGYCIWNDEQQNAVTLWMSSEGVLQPPFTAPTTKDELFIQMRKGQEDGKTFHVVEMGGKKLVKHYQYMRSLPVVGEILDSIIAAGHPLPTFQIMHHAYFSKGFLLFITYEPVPDAHDIFQRFASVFDQTYTRFLDLQKAEAQAREAQIEAALERVRSRTMAMQKSEELKEIIKVVYEQLVHINIAVEHAGFIMDYKESDDMHIWLADQHYIPSEITIPYFDSPHWNSFKEAKAKGREFFANHLNFEEKNKFYKDLFALFPVPDKDKEYYFTCPGLAISTVLLDDVGLYIENFSGTPYTEEENTTLMRFGKVFQQTYTRFLDLQKAEAQARESQIQLALERVRARTMAMQHSDELREVVQTMYHQLQTLHFNANASNIVIADKHTGNREFWIAGFAQDQYPESYKVPYFNHPYVDAQLTAWRNGEAYSVFEYTGEMKKTYDAVFFTKTDFKKVPAKAKATMIAIPFLKFSTAFFSHGYLQTLSKDELTEENATILQRFAKVFEQTYTRFLDLKKAEAQAREAQIEAALERVRSRTMAMHKSDELPETSHILFEQMKELGEPVEQLTIGIINEENHVVEISATLLGDTLKKIYNHSIDEPYMMAKVYKAWKKQQKTLVVELRGDELNAYNQYRNELTNSKMFPTNLGKEQQRIVCAAFFSKGMLALGANEKRPPESLQLLLKFASVFDLTYTRFLDLQKAEAQTREAKIEASLERVRSKAMAMHNTQDLSDTIHVFYRELQMFSITPRRCGVGLLDKQSRSGELFTWNTTEHGESLELVGRLIMEGHPVLEKVYEGWLTQTDYYPVLRGDEIKEYYKVIRPQISFPDYAHDEVQYGYFFFFNEGGVYAWTEKEMKEDELQIYRRFTSVLSLTYKRYKDLQQAETLAVKAEQDLILLKEEKKRTEDALNELQAAQKQLIQSEKMASLGELTAGIAHEIQNPLNFVNNFSEVSTELIDEMNEEIAKGNVDDAKQIAEDLKQNLEKINHHGKRAGDIVKGMLQHSRSSSATKEPTNINKLADEYLRLAYHGLRAKDKTFNATMKTDFDESIGNINIIPQDIGRVILNLITNAFYAVNEKAKQNIVGFEPTVEVSTMKEDNTVLIAVKDNGSGIPQKVLDKIFQPFFTTKPTGQGTGLGLSLSYDIVKAHGGELKVETKEREGSTFTIQL